jgi:hypothetical protein
MKALFTTVVLIIILANINLSAQKGFDELLDHNKRGWNQFLYLSDSANNDFEILPKDSMKAVKALLDAQVTTRSTMGAVIYETGGILIDNGWIRIIGSGSEKLTRSLMKWNENKSYDSLGQRPSFLLIADDVLGGFFAINGGGIESENLGKIYYFVPDGLYWDNTELGYSEFINFCLNGNLDLFYDGLRWENWESNLKEISGDEGFYFYPFLWTKEGQNINDCEKSIVPIQELWDFHFKAKIKE